MTQAFNLSQLANKTNTAGQIDLSTAVSSTLPIANGGTGSTSTTYCNLATNVTGTLPISNGGTGSTTASGALANLGGLQGSTTQLAKAWVRFSGSTGSITSQFNVSSVTRNATAFYTVNMTNALSSANYVVVGTGSNQAGGGSSAYTFCAFTGNSGGNYIAPTTTNFACVTVQANLGFQDNTTVSAVVFL
jgi:hypothetical protein